MQALKKRERVIMRLEKQLNEGIKPVQSVGFEPLTADDIKRINKELKILKIRL